MKKIINKVYILLIFVLLPAMIFGIISVYASTEDEIEELVNELGYPGTTYTAPVKAPFSFDGSNESVNYATGNLVIKSEDLYLKGKNGLDLSLVRYYELQNALLEEPELDVDSSGNFENDTHGKSPEYDRYEIGTGWTFDLPFIEERGDEKYLHFGLRGTYLMDIDNYDNNPNNLEDYDLMDIKIERGGGYNGSSYVLTEKKGKKYYFDEDGSLIGIVDRFGNEIRVTNSSDRINYIIDSVGRTIDFTYDSAGLDRITVTDETNTNIIHEINYDIEYKDYKYDYGNSYYNLSGYLLTKVTDAKGNETNYTYYHKRESETFFTFLDQNEDSYDFYYEDDWGDHGRWEETFYGHPNYTALLKEIEYSTGAKTRYEYNECIKNCGPGGSIQYWKFYKAYELSKENIQKNIRTALYDHAQAPAPIAPDRGAFDGFPLYYKGNWVGYKHDINTGEELWNTPDEWEVKTRKGTNHYLDTDPDSDHFYTTNYYNYNNDLLIDEKIEKEWQRDGLEEIKTIFEYNDNKQIIKKRVKRYPSDDGGTALTETVENYEYDEDSDGNSYNDLIGYWDVQNDRYGGGNPKDNEHKTTYTYHPTYHYILSKEYKRDSTHQIKEEYTPTSDSKSLEWSKINEKVGTGSYQLKKKTRYAYDTYGNVTEQREYPDILNTNYISTYYSYDDNVSARINNNVAFNGAYLTRKWTTGIKDADGNLITPRTGNSSGVMDEVYTYDWFGNLIKSKDGIGNETSYIYDSLNRITKQTNPGSSTVEYNYDDLKNTVTVTDEIGNSIKYAYDEFGKFRYEKDLEKDKIVRKQVWGINNRILYEQNGEKSCTEYEIDAANRLETKYVYEQSVWFDSSLPLGAELGNTNDQWKWKYGFDREDEVYHYTRNKAGIHGHSFENADEKLNVESGDYIILEFDIIEENNPSEIMIQFHCYEDDSWEHRAYWGDNLINLGTEGAESRKYIGAIPSYGDLEVLADDIGLAGKKIDGIKFTLHDGQCEFGMVGIYKGSDDSNNIQTKYYSYEYAEYNEDEYDKVRKFVIDSPSVLTIDCYDRKTGFLQQREKGRNSISYKETYKYDYLGNNTEIKNARAYDEGWSNESTIQIGYNFEGKEIKNTNILGNFTEKKYDDIGRLKNIKDYKGNWSSYIYDNLGRIIKEEIPFKDSNYTQNKYYYDRNGNKVEEKILCNKPGETESYRKIKYEYDNRNRLINVITYDEETPENYTQYYYDNAGNIRRMYTGLSSPLTIDGLDNVTSSGDNEYSCTEYNNYDSYGRVGQITDALNNSESFIYDINGNIIRKTDRNGNITANTFDGMNRLISENVITPDNNIISNTYEYSSIGNLLNINNGETSYEYDELGRLIKEKETDGITKEYTYDAHNNVKTFKLKQNGTVKQNVSYEYDKLDRLYRVKDSGTVIATYTYDDNGNRQTLTYNSGNNISYTYNDANLVEIIQNKKGTTQISKYEYTYYLDGNSESETKNGTDTIYYSYDGLNRLKEVILPDSTVTAYTFDDSSNRINMTKGSETTSYEYDANNRLLKETNILDNITTVTSYKYDNNGNQLEKAKEKTGPQSDQGERYNTAVLGVDDQKYYETYEYDGLNRLVTAKLRDNTVNYTYNPNNLRKTKEVNGEVTKHIWNGQNIIAKADGNNNITANYIRGINLIKTKDGTTNTYHIYNGHGDVIQLTDNTGNVTKDYKYDAFGNEENIDPNDNNPFRYCGGMYYFDKETGDYYLKARYYDPQIGRLISEDSYRGNYNDPLSLNLYTYAHNNPITYNDPTGHVVDTVLDAAALSYDVIAISNNPKDVENWAALVADGTCAIIPIATGGGVLVRNTDEAMKAGKAFVKKIEKSGSSIISKVKSAVSKGWNKFKGLFKGTGSTYANFAKQATKNVNSTEVVLGKFNQGGISYTKVAEQRGATYFQLDNWDNVVKEVGEKNIWNINESFIRQQASANKTFILSHDPAQATGYFANEVNLLKNMGYSFKQEGSVWRAIK